MASVTLSVPDAMKEWIDRQVIEGDYASTGDYLRDLVRRDRERRTHPDLSLDDLRRMVEEARAGGPGELSPDDIKAEARRRAAATRSGTRD
ncbi:type II toxin-antitoxin system ParD family antitoxin [Jiella endophytica]|uniref:Type II toxin-antitoxin system ParD family antitoxin n=2 Tax=Jiella endophytica TaxID=2558362 RepID=A0A4Y8RBA9_9HYPH|nr:type II toxin-antitoxin system ParD family antitoxin [Jiella endophytica]